MEQATKTVLLVEDNPGDAFLFIEALQEAGGDDLSLESVNRLSLALERLSRGGIDLCLLDLGLPDSTGLATFNKARQYADDVAFVVLTGLEDETAAVTAVRNGAQDFLVKGQIDGPSLVRTIRYAIERKRLQNETWRNLESMRQLVETLPVAARVIQDGVVVFSNRADAALFGFDDPKEILQSSAWSQFETESATHLQHLVASCLADSTIASNREVAQARKKSGVEFNVELTINPIVYNGRPACLAVLVDIDERKKLHLYESLLPICSVCGKVRDDTGKERGQGDWLNLQDYVVDRSETSLSHTFCPTCLVDYRKQMGLPPEEE